MGYTELAFCEGDIVEISDTLFTLKEATSFIAGSLDYMLQG